MKIIKKSDIKKYKRDEKEELDELVDANGDMTSGDKVLNSDSQITTGQPITTNDHEEGTVQHRSIFGYGSTSQARGGIQKVSESDLRSIIEDILNKKSDGNDLVSKENDIDSKISKFVTTLKATDTDINIDSIMMKIKDKLSK